MTQILQCFAWNLNVGWVGTCREKLNGCSSCALDVHQPCKKRYVKEQIYSVLLVNTSSKSRDIFWYKTPNLCVITSMASFSSLHFRCLHVTFLSLWSFFHHQKLVYSWVCSQPLRQQQPLFSSAFLWSSLSCLPIDHNKEHREKSDCQL